jgi:hypothetical protein
VSTTIKTEHAGAKNGGGHYGRREEAKRLSRPRRRANGKQEIREALRTLADQRAKE